VTIILLILATLVGGLIFGNMSLAYRETGFTTIDSDGATVLEPTTGQTFQVSTNMITTRLPESHTNDNPGVGWSDTKYLVLYDPYIVMVYTLSISTGIVVLSAMYTLWEFWMFVPPTKSCKCRGNQCQDCGRNLWMCVWLSVWALAALVGGAYIGARDNKVEEGVCGPRYFQNIPNAPSTQDGGPHLDGHWAVEFYGASNNFQNTYEPVYYSSSRTWQTNIWPVDISSPHPKTASACWLDTISQPGGVTFNNPYWVQVIFWACMGGVALGCLLLQYWCCTNPCFSCMEPTFEACDKWCNSLWNLRCCCCCCSSQDQKDQKKKKDIKMQCNCCGCQCVWHGAAQAPSQLTTKPSLEEKSASDAEIARKLAAPPAMEQIMAMASAPDAVTIHVYEKKMDLAVTPSHSAQSIHAA